MPRPRGSRQKSPEMSLRRIYRILLRSYPPDFKAFFAAEMTFAFDEGVIDCRGRLSGLIAFMFAELTGLLSGACREWIARLAYSLSHTNSYINGRGLPDPLLMKWYSLMDKVCGLPNLLSAFREVKRKGGGAGVDHQTIKMFERDLMANLMELSAELASGRYRPRAIKRTWIPKPGSREKRPLGIPMVVS